MFPGTVGKLAETPEGQVHNMYSSFTVCDENHFYFYQTPTPMHPHEIIQVKGCITQERFIKGKTLPELERLLGFQKGRLDNGIVVAALIQLPTVHQFELLGYTQVAEHKFNTESTKGLDIDKLKELVLKETFTLVGTKRLVKVMANTPHNENLNSDLQYPPGQGIPQWKLTSRVSARVLDTVSAGEVYN